MHVISVLMQKQFCKANLYVNLQMPSLIVDLNNAKKNNEAGALMVGPFELRV